MTKILVVLFKAIFKFNISSFGLTYKAFAMHAVSPETIYNRLCYKVEWKVATDDNQQLQKKENLGLAFAKRLQVIEKLFEFIFIHV